MSTYRERRLAKAERLREWADGREEKAQAAQAGVHAIADMIPMGQPILVGHHSAGRHRRDVERIERGMSATVEHSRKAERFRERADNIERAANRAIYSDDADAIERLEAKIADMESRREAMKKANADFRKAHRAELKGMSAYERDRAVPHPGYELTNLGGNISRTRKRLEQMRREAAMVEAGERGLGRRMLAKYGGECADCETVIDRGEPMTYYRMTRECVCSSCDARK